MNHRAYRLQFSQNPLVQIAATIVAIFVVIGAVFLGAVVLFFLVGFAILAWLSISIRLWWLRRQARQPGQRGAHRDTERSEIVGVEYTVVEERPSRPRDSENSR